MTFPSRSGIAAGQSPVRCGDSGTVPLLREESEMNGGALRVLAEVEFEAFAFAQVGAGCFALPAELGQGIVVEGDDRLRRDGAPRESLDNAAAGLVEHQAAGDRKRVWQSV